MHSSSRVFAFRLRIAFITGLLVCLSLPLSEEGRTAAVNRSGDGPTNCSSAQNICTANSVHGDGKTSHLCVKVRVDDGRPKVDRENTSVYVTEEFVRRLGPSKLTLEQVKKVLFDRIDAAFAHSDRLIYYALTPDQQTAVRAQSCQALAGEALKNERALCELTGPWENFFTVYSDWKQTITRPTPDFDRILYNRDVEAYLKEIDFDSSLNFADPLGDAPTYDGNAGLLFLRVADPIGDWKDPEYQICISDKCDGKSSDAPRTVAAPQDIRKVLKPLNGYLWNQSGIKGMVQEYYGGKGLLASVEVGSPFSDEGKVIKIKESPRLLSINFPADMEPSQIDKAMYLLLPDSQFRRFIKCREDFTPSGPADPRIVVEIQELLRQGTCSDPEELDDELPYLNLIKLQLQKLQLNSIDLDVAVGTTTDQGEEYVFLQVLEAEKADEEKKGENDRAAALPNAEGRFDTNLSRPETQTSFVPRVTVQPSPSPSPTPTPLQSPTPSASPTPSPSPDDSGGEKKEKKNYLGGGFEYRTGEGVRVFGIYQRSQLLFGNDGFSLQVGGHDKPLGSVSYYADYVAFGLLRRKLTLQFTGSSELNAQRLFSRQNTDERRTGGLARAELELFRDRGGNLLRLSVEAQRMTIELNQKDKTVGKQNLSTLDFGALYLFQPDYELQYPRWARLEPRLRFGLGLAQSEPRFNAFFMTGNFHQKLPGFFEVDMGGRIGLTSRNTPIFEQATLGGPESVRGFRQDEAIGRRMWSLQNELWIPLPGTTNSAAEFQRFLLRSVRLTAFVDLGSVSKTIGSQPGLRFGPGAGLRFIFNPVVIKVDWAYGLTSANVTSGRGRFSFSIVSNLPF